MTQDKILKDITMVMNYALRGAEESLPDFEAKYDPDITSYEVKMDENTSRPKVCRLFFLYFVYTCSLFYFSSPEYYLSLVLTR